MPRVNWTREETIITINLYCKIPFNRVSSNHPEIIRISQIIKRSPNAIKMKIGNFGRFDPELRKRGIVGLSNGSKLDQIIWDEFNNNWDDLAYESEVLIAKLSNKSLEEITGIEIFDIPEGKERESIVKQRVNQNFFRSTILSCYDSRCCITCLSIPNFLVASHIIPWSKDKKNRLNPRNGLCLNYLHDKAFDKGYITITQDYKVQISRYFNDFQEDDSVINLFLKYKDKDIILPTKFLPSREFLDYHKNKIFIS